MNFSKADLQKETSFKASRSGGKGGQNVNKVSSKVEMLFVVESSALFTDDEKQLLLSKLQNRLNKDGFVQVVCDEERSQYLNKEKALEKLYMILTTALQVTKPRKPTKLPKGVVAARLETKRRQSVKKENRRGDFGD